MASPAPSVAASNKSVEASGLLPGCLRHAGTLGACSSTIGGTAVGDDVPGVGKPVPCSSTPLGSETCNAAAAGSSKLVMRLPRVRSSVVVVGAADAPGPLLGMIGDMDEFFGVDGGCGVFDGGKVNDDSGVRGGGSRVGGDSCSSVSSAEFGSHAAGDLWVKEENAAGSGCTEDRHDGMDVRGEDGVCALVEPHSRLAIGSGVVASVVHSVPTWEEEGPLSSYSAGVNYVYPMFGWTQFGSSFFDPNSSSGNAHGSMWNASGSSQVAGVGPPQVASSSSVAIQTRPQSSEAPHVDPVVVSGGDGRYVVCDGVVPSSVYVPEKGFLDRFHGRVPGYSHNQRSMIIRPVSSLLSSGGPYRVAESIGACSPSRDRSSPVGSVRDNGSDRDIYEDKIISGKRVHANTPYV